MPFLKRRLKTFSFSAGPFLDRKEAEYFVTCSSGKGGHIIYIENTIEHKFHVEILEEFRISDLRNILKYASSVAKAASVGEYALELKTTEISLQKLNQYFHEFMSSDCIDINTDGAITATVYGSKADIASVFYRLNTVAVMKH